MRIGIVNDMPLAVEALRRALMQAPEHTVVWIAEDGAQAVKLCARDTPDLVLMDLLMPVMDGVEATRRIMAETPCMILVVTVSVRNNSARAFEAMGYGALDVLNTPTLGSSSPEMAAAPLLTKINSMKKLLDNRHWMERGHASDSSLLARKNKLVAIGASAGGPAALAKVLSGVPESFPAAIVIVQHIDEKFIPQMANWLSQQSVLPVRPAKEGDHPKAGTILLAATNDHLTFKTADSLGYSHEPSDYVYRPSVDVFFKSVCKFWPGKATGVLLTGMGRDGALGLQAMRQKGHHTIAQNQESSAVYGMPKAAVALNAAIDILPLDQIAHRLTTVFSEKEVRRD